GHLQPGRPSGDRDPAGRAEQPGTVHRELAHRTGTPDRDDVGRLDGAHLRAHVAGGQDVGEEQYLLVAQVRLDLQWPDVGERYPRVLRLAAGVPAGQVGVAEDPGGRMAEHPLRDAGVGIAVLATGVELGRAGTAGTTGDRERYDHPVADPQPIRVDVRADLDDLAHELVPQHVAVLHGRDVAVDQVQVRTADRGRGDPYDR